MKKADQLRAYLTAAIPLLKREPERLRVFIDKGSVVSTGTTSISWLYAYRLNLLLTDYAGSPDDVFLPIVAWLQVHQRELLQAMAKGEGGVAFEADILDDNKVDLSIDLDLTERVVATKVAGGYELAHPDEPPLDPGFGPWPDTVPDPASLTTIYAGELQIVPQPE